MEQSGHTGQHGRFIEQLPEFPPGFRFLDHRVSFDLPQLAELASARVTVVIAGADNPVMPQPPDGHRPEFGRAIGADREVGLLTPFLDGVPRNAGELSQDFPAFGGRFLGFPIAANGHRATRGT